MYYVYILKSSKHKSLYIGYTSDLRRRLQQHNSSGKKYTSVRGTWELIYYEAYKEKIDAMERERKLKNYGSSLGHLKQRMKKSLE